MTHLEKVINKAEKSCLESVARNERMDGLHKRFCLVGGVRDITSILNPRRPSRDRHAT